LRKTAHDRQAGRRQRPRKCFGGFAPLRGCIAAADDRQRGPIQQLAAAAKEQRRRRICNGQQCPRIRRIVPGEERVAGVAQPRQREVKRSGVRAPMDGRRDVSRHDLGKHGRRCREDFAGATKKLE
jgi:hypothetical protein